MKKAIFNMEHLVASLRRISVNTRQSHLATDSAQKTRATFTDIYWELVEHLQWNFFEKIDNG